MKSAALAKQLQQLTGQTTNEAALEAITQALNTHRPVNSPKGVLLLIPSEIPTQEGTRLPYFATLVGTPLDLTQTRALQVAARDYANTLDGPIAQMIEERAINRLKAPAQEVEP